MLSSPLILNYNIFDGEKAVDPEITKMIMNKEAVRRPCCAACAFPAAGSLGP